MSGSQTLHLDDGLTVTAKQVRDMPIVSITRLSEIYGRLSILGRAKGPHVIGCTGGGQLSLARYWPAPGWRQVSRNVWRHDHCVSQDRTPAFRHACVWATAAPRLTWNDGAA